jgi:putative DNA primase/helicase
VPPAAGEVHEVVAYSGAHEKFWDRCEPITADSPVGRYLLNRGCPLPREDADLRWRPDYPHLHPSARWRGPVMVGRITNALTLEPMSFHFTWVQPTGAGKAPVERPRLMAPGMAKQGGVVRLCDDEDVRSFLVVGEGIESCLAGQAGLADTLGEFAPTWATLDAGNLARLPYLEHVRRLLVLVDTDKPNPRTGRYAGHDAGVALGDRWHWEARNPIRIHFLFAPGEGQDTNDLLNATRISPGAAA